MTPREIDALVAEKVMGWSPRGPHPFSGSPVFATGANDTLAPRFSADIAAAWKVVDYMCGDGFNVSVFANRCEVGLWTVTFWCPLGPCEKHGNTKPDSGHGSNAHADTAPMAIALAALKAVGVEAAQ